MKVYLITSDEDGQVRKEIHAYATKTQSF